MSREINENPNNPDVSLKEVFGQELQEYLYSEEAENTHVHRDMFDFDHVKPTLRGFCGSNKTDNVDTFFDDVSPDEFGLNTEDLFGLSLLTPVDELEDVLKIE